MAMSSEAKLQLILSKFKGRGDLYIYMDTRLDLVLPKSNTFFSSSLPFFTSVKLCPMQFLQDILANKKYCLSKSKIISDRWRRLPHWDEFTVATILNTNFISVAE